MSNAGQAALGIVGAVVGFVVTGGNPMGAVYGFQLGYLAGTALFPTQLPHMQGPRLGEGQQTASVVGQPIPWIFGTQTVGGNIIWASPLREVANTETAGGKGSSEQKQTTYSYYRSFAILLCEGPIAGVRRIWANGKIIYDVSLPPGVTMDEFPGVGSGSLIARALVAQAAVSENLAQKMTIYLGTEDQMPDPVIESFEGVGNVPAHRGYAYVVFDDLELKPEDGYRVPASWKFEVFEEGNFDTADATLFSNEVMYPWNPDAPNRHDPRNFQNEHEYQLRAVASTYAMSNAEISLPGPWRTSLGDALSDFNPYFGYNGPRTSDLIGWSISTGTNNWTSNLRPITSDALPMAREFTYLHFNEEGSGAKGYYPRLPYFQAISGDCYACIFGGGLTAGGGDALWWGHRYSGHPDPANGELNNQYTLGVYTWNEIEAASGRQEFENNCSGVIFIPNDQQLLVTPDAIIAARRVPQPPPDPAEVGTPVPGVPGWYVVYGMLMQGGSWQRDESTTYRALQSYGTNGTPSLVRMPLNPIRPLGHPDYNDQAFWEAAYAIEVARGRMAAGLVYGVDYPVTQAFGYRKTLDITAAETMPVSLASIVSRVCERTGLHAYNVDDLEDQFVIGYQLARPMAGRAAIEPLRSVGFFDVLESSIQLKFPRRGKVVVDTLDTEDMAAHFINDQRPSEITTRKAQEFELPRQVRVHYQNPERDFDPGEELSPPRIETAAETVLDIDLAVAISPDQAAKIAEVIQRDFWAGRWTHGTHVDQSKSALEAADCIGVPVDGQVYRMRIPSLTDRLPNLRTLELVRDDDGTYVSYAVGSTAHHTPQTITVYGPVESTYLDLPALTFDETGAGFYFATRPLLTGGDFRGANVARSIDDGNTYTTIAGITVADEMGQVVDTALPSGPTSIWDEGNVLTVELDYGTLENRTAQDVMDGANAAAIGVHGRWEIVQFRNAVNLAGNVWRLTGLLRGRRGTEHNVGTSVVGDAFVMLSTDAIARVPLLLEDVGDELLLKTLPIGYPPEAVEAEAFTPQGVSLQPFSPVHVTAEQDDVSGDWVIAWVRRDRLAQTLQSGTDVPLSEDQEDYEVEILTDTGEVRRTISVSTAEAIYGWEQQVADFGEVQTALRLRVYQISAQVGRGIPATFEIVET